MKITYAVRAVALAIVLCGGQGYAATPDSCVSTPDIAGVPAPLGRVAKALVPGQTLNVLAVGSATLFGPDAALSNGTVTSQALGAGPSGAANPMIFTQEASERSFPRQMAKLLKASVPGSDVRIVVRGGRGLLATDMLAILKKELAAAHYQMVIWQTGTVEAVRNLPPGEFGQILSDGAEAVLGADADLVLVDPQFSRFLQTNANLDPYAQAMLQVASMPGVALFRRFDLMRNWANEGQLDLERTGRGDRRHVIETLHACLGRYLARFVLDSARS